MEPEQDYVLVMNDKSLTVCPYCLDQGGIVRLASGRTPGGPRELEKFCQFHGQITGIQRLERRPKPAGAESETP